MSIMLWSIAPAMVASIPSVVLGRTLGLEAVGLYMVSFRVPQMVAMLALRGYHAFFPKLQNLHVTGMRDRFLVFYRLSTALSLWMTGIGLTLALVFNRDAVNLLSRPDYYAGDWTTFWFVMGFIVMAWSEHLGTLFIIAGKAKLVSVVLLVEVGLIYAFASLLCPRYGVVGVAAALALTPLLLRIPYYLIMGPRVCSFGLREIYGAATLILTAAVMLVAGVHLIVHSVDSPVSRSSGMLLCLAAIVCGVISLRGTWRDFLAITTYVNRPPSLSD